MKSKMKKAHDSFMVLLAAADLDPGDRNLLIAAWDEVVRAGMSGNKHRLAKAIDKLCRLVRKHVE